jgi:5-methylcytosine-specific restriction endonuclease McrA
MTDALVLNATFEPLCVVPARRAVVLVLTGRATSLEDGEQVLHSERMDVAVPSVVRLTRFVKVPYRARIPLTRRAVFARDGGRCAYCTAPATSLDHVVPRSRGGLHAWDNVVAACGRCNNAKANRTPSEMGWRLHVPPAAPRGPSWLILAVRRVDPRWSSYLGEVDPAVAVG